MISVSDEAQETFREYIKDNYPAGCVLSDPMWHAPKLMRAVIYALERAGYRIVKEERSKFVTGQAEEPAAQPDLRAELLELALTVRHITTYKNERDFEQAMDKIISRLEAKP